MTGRPPAWSVLGTLVAAPIFIGFVIVYVPWMFTGWRSGPPLLGWALTRWLGAALIALSLPIVLDFLVRFVHEGHGTPIPIAPPQRLVVHGVFRFVRNPSYLAAIANVLGQALWFGNAATAYYAVFLALWFHVLVVTYEEPTLRRKFGDEYEEYCRRVGRWLPRRPSAR